MSSSLETRPVGPGETDALSRLFASERTTRHCWCMSFCTTRTQFAAGWFGGGNRRRFEAMAAGGTAMGVLAQRGGVPVGWAACGPRLRYAATSPDGLRLLVGRPDEDGKAVWFTPCLFVRADHRGQGVSHALVLAAVGLAAAEGAVSLESWPLAATEQRSADAFVGREQLFAELGFRRVGRPTAARVIMRRDLVD